MAQMPDEKSGSQERAKGDGTVRAWLQALNSQNVQALLALSDPAIEIIGPQGSAQGHEVLKAWLERAGLHLKPGAYFGSTSQILVICEGAWRDTQSGQSRGQKELAMLFDLSGDKVTRCQRFDALPAVPE